MLLPSIFTDIGHQPKVLRGGVKLTAAAARSLVPTSRGDSPVTIAGLPIPERYLFRGMTIQGMQGSAKTLTILRMLLPVLYAMALPSSRRKLVVVDVKGDLTSSVLGLIRVVCPGVPIHLLNPFDRFGSALDPHEFASDPTRILQTVHALTYRKRDARTDDFFDSSGRSYLVELVKTLHRRARGRWNWRTLFLLATSYDLLERVLKNSKTGRRKAQKIVKKTFSGIVSTIESWLDQYESAFACWDKSPVFSIEKFMQGRGVLILTIPEDQVESLAPIARLVLRKIKDRVLTDANGDPEGKTAIVFDEFADLHGIADTIYPLYGRSRSSNCQVVTAWQAWPAVCATHGEEIMKGICDNAAVRIWLACGLGGGSAEFASKNCSSAEVKRWDESHAYGREYTRTVSSRTEIRSHVLPGEFHLPLPGPGDMRVRGFLQAPHFPGPVYFEDDYQPFIDFLNLVPRVKSFRPRPVSDHFLDPWSNYTDGSVLNALFKKEK